MNPLKFNIEQIAIAPENSERAKQLLIDLGMADWVEDHVVANGSVFGMEDETNEAHLRFNYQSCPKLEFEILEYTKGKNWLDSGARPRKNSVSHLGMHCTAKELIRWRHFFKNRYIDITQEVFTQSHSNPFLQENGRKFNYVIFNTKPILGVDLKFIVRIDREESAWRFWK